VGQGRLTYAAGQVVSGRWDQGVLVEPDTAPAPEAPAEGNDG